MKTMNSGSEQVKEAMKRKRTTSAASGEPGHIYRRLVDETEYMSAEEHTPTEDISSISDLVPDAAPPRAFCATGPASADIGHALGFVTRVVGLGCIEACCEQAAKAVSRELGRLDNSKFSIGARCASGRTRRPRTRTRMWFLPNWL